LAQETRVVHKLSGVFPAASNMEMRLAVVFLLAVGVMADNATNATNTSTMMMMTTTTSTRDPHCGQIDDMTGGGVIWDNSLALEDGAEINGGLNGEGSGNLFIFYNVPEFLTTSSSGKWRRYWGSIYGVQKWPFDATYVNTTLEIRATGPLEMYVWLQGVDNKAPNDPGPGQEGTNYIAAALYDEGFSYVETEGFWRYRGLTNANQTMIVLKKYYSQVGPFNLTFATIPGRLVMGVVEDMSWVCTPPTSTTTMPMATSTNTTTTTAATNTTTATVTVSTTTTTTAEDDQVWVGVLVVALVATVALIASLAGYSYCFLRIPPVEHEQVII